MKKLIQLGQNFLTDPLVAEQIAASAEIKTGEEVWEIGPGMGILTGEILKYQPKLTAFELDRRLIPHLEERFGKNINLIQGDILRQDWRQLTQGRQLKLLSNLPYQITSPLLELLEKYHERFTLSVLMLQKEVAQRLQARAGCKAYGALTIRLRLLFDTEILLQVPRELFDPIPKVDSTVLRFSPRANPSVITNPGMFHRLVRLGFANRRKTLKNNLKSYFSPESLEQAEASSGIDLSRRAETLNEAEFIRLSDLF